MRETPTDELDRVHQEWFEQGSPVTLEVGVPPELKHWLIREEARRAGIRVLVETGSYRGDTIAAMLPYFDEIHSVELSPELHASCRDRFAGNAQVHLALGESPDFLRRIVAEVAAPCLFFLDAHWTEQPLAARATGETPVLEELAAIEQHCPPSVAIVDDVRMFGLCEWPVLRELHEHVEERMPRCEAVEIGDQMVVRGSKVSTT